MRQEMKVGFAIGGVLLAVLVVYVLVVSSRDARKANSEVGLDTSGPTVSFPADHADNSAKTNTSNSETAKVSPPADVKTDLMQPDTMAKGPSTAPSNSSLASSESTKGSTNDPWAAALSTGTVPMMSTTPTKKSSGESQADLTMVQKLDKINFGTGSEKTAARSQPRDITTVDSSNDSTGSGSTANTTASGSARTHTVASGETFASIAKAAYGSAAYYPHILRANPNVDPKRLKVGTVLQIPPVEDVKPSESKTETTSEPKTSAAASNDFTPKKPIDEKTQYVVQSGDSLYRISVKLYGKASFVDKIAQANIGTAGADRRLKVGQVLSLPEPPTTH